MDEESKLKDMPTVNIKITEAWNKWLSQTGRQCLPGDFIAGKVCVYQKSWRGSCMTEKDDRGDLDLTKQIDDLKKEIEYLKKEMTIFAWEL